jgi:hypothetical protein
VGPARRSGGAAWLAAARPRRSWAAQVRAVAKQGQAGVDRWALTTVPGGGGLNTIQIQTNSNYFKTF